MRDTFLSRLMEKILGGSQTAAQFFDQWTFLFIGIGFGLSVMILLILLGRYFVRWGYEEILISRGRDSLGRRKRRPSSRRHTVRWVSGGRQRRLPGIRYRRGP